MRADSFLGQLVVALSRRSPAFTPAPRSGPGLKTALVRSTPAFKGGYRSAAPSESRATGTPERSYGEVGDQSAVEVAHVDEATAELVQLCAYLDTDAIDLKLILSEPQLLVGPLTGRLAKAVATEAGQREVITNLKLNGSFTSLGDDRVRMNSSAAESIRSGHDRDETDEAWAAHALDLILGLIPTEPQEQQNWPLAGDLAAHASAVAARVQTGAAGSLLTLLGRYQEARGQYESSLSTLQRAVAVMETVYGDNAEELVSTLDHLGRVQRSLGLHPAARATQERAIRLAEASYGPDDLRLAAPLGDLATILGDLGELTAAESLLQRVLLIRETKAGPMDPSLAYTLGNLGHIEISLARLAGQEKSQRELLAVARGHLQRALAISEATSGPDSPETAIAETNLAEVLHRMGDTHGALARLQRAVEINDANFDAEPDHPNIAYTLMGLGALQQETGDLSASLSSLQRALAILDARVGPVHSDIAYAMGLLALVQEQLGEFPAAEASRRRQSEIADALSPARRRTRGQ